MAFVYDLSYRHGLPPSEIRALIGGKAANLGVMAGELGLPVPDGFVLATSACREYLAGGWPEGLDDEVREHIRRMEERLGRRFGDPADPLLVSVRSGAPISMPGMMDTVLNLGLTEQTAAGLARVTGSGPFAADCLSRFVAQFTAVVGVAEVPADPWRQLRAAIEAVFRSWNSDRARAYRRVEGIADDLGTAVTVQAMVFGNRGPDSATGVLFTRDPATGERAVYGDVLFDAQGEDVVAGGNRTEPLTVLDERMPAVAAQLWRCAGQLERHFADMCDIEFTIERGKLWLLQVRAGKRSPQAALRIAVDMAEDPDFPLTPEQAVRRVAGLLASPPRTWQREKSPTPAIATGLPASPGVAVGRLVTTPAGVDELADAGEQVILARAETSPADVPAMARAAGVLTSLGGLASHAAVVARGWGVPAVVGAAAVQVTETGLEVNGKRLAVGETLTIDGSTGEVFLGAVRSAAVPAPEVATMLGWAEELGVDVGSMPQLRSGPASVTGRDEEAGRSDRPLSEDDVIACLSVKTIAAPDAVATALLTDPERVGPVLDALAARGLVRLSGGTARLTGEGTDRARALVAAEGNRWGLDQAASALHDFVALDKRVKDVVTAWQLRDMGGRPAVNDHSDQRYDAEVLATLTALHEEAVRWLRSFGAVARLAVYASRLDRALAAARAGDHRFVASPRVDSYHGVWFELHEDLIRLAGRTREEETAAGRA